MQRSLCARLLAGAFAVVAGQAWPQTSIVVNALDNDESSMAQPATNCAAVRARASAIPWIASSACNPAAWRRAPHGR